MLFIHQYFCASMNILQATGSFSWLKVLASTIQTQIHGLNSLGQRSQFKSGSLNLIDVANCVWIVQSVSISSAPWSIFSPFSRRCSVASLLPHREQRQWPRPDTLGPIVGLCLCRTCNSKGNSVRKKK